MGGGGGGEEGESKKQGKERKGKRRTLLPGPLAFMMRDLSTSAGEQTVVATVPCFIVRRD